MNHLRKLKSFIKAQCLIAAGFALVAGGMVGNIAALSVLAGGCVAASGSVIYALILRKVDVGNPASILHLHFVAEIAKLLAMFSAIAVLFVFCRQISWIWFFAGFFAAYSAYWFGLLIKN